MPSGFSKESSHQDKNGENGHCAFEDLDHSVLQQPLNLGVTNVKQILKCVQSGSKEVKDVILNECNVIYECKACGGLFRSLANFVYHKRCYCKKHLCEGMLLFEKFEEEETIVVNPEAPTEKIINHTETANPANCSLVETDVKMDSANEITIINEIPGTSKASSLVSGDDKVNTKPERTESPMISRRTRDKNAQHKTKMALKSASNEEMPIKRTKIMSARIMKKDSIEKSPIITKKERLQSAVDKDIKSKKKETIKFVKDAEEKPISCKKILLKTIDTNPHAMYQSSDKKKLHTLKLNKKIGGSTVQTKVDRDKLVIVLKKDSRQNKSAFSKVSESIKIKEMEKLSDFHLTRRKRLSSRNDCNVQQLRCLTCKTQFMSLKTLYFHMLSLHSRKRLYYPCPFCKTFFVQMYGVTRHLMSIHNKTKDQINKKLRDIIKKKSVWKRIEDVRQSLDPEERADRDTVLELHLEKQLEELKMAEISTPISSPKKEPELPSPVISQKKSEFLHKCAKCGRVFGRKSSQVSHEKFCIMTPQKSERGDSPPPNSCTTSPSVSFLLPQTSPLTQSTNVSPAPKPSVTAVMKPTVSLVIKKQNIVTSRASLGSRSTADSFVSARPKRGAEKQMHKDFVNSQTLKWRSANKIETSPNTKPPPPIKKVDGKNLEKKVLNFMDADTLVCIKCNKKFSSYSNLRRHVAIHVGWTRFKCKYCDYQAYNKSQCWAHIQKTHAVNDDDFDECIVNLVNTKTGATKKKICTSKIQSKLKQSPIKAEAKVVASKKKNVISSRNEGSEKKPMIIPRKEQSEEKMAAHHNELKKEIIVIQKKKSVFTTPVPKVLKRDTNEEKKEKPHAMITIQKFPIKDEEKTQPTIMIQKIPRKQVIEKKEKAQHIIPMQKFTIADCKRESNYKSLTTSNPTTIILSKRIPSTTAPSIVTISPDSSPIKISSMRTSPRKSETKEQDEKLVTNLVAQSNINPKVTPIQIKLPPKSNSAEESSQNGKKEKLISEWFPKKDLCSTNIRRESAPLIIGLVPASSVGASGQPKKTEVEKASSEE